MKSLVLGILIIAALSLFVVALNLDLAERAPDEITTFEECVEAGNPVAESYPRQCRTEDGELFVEDIGNELEKGDLIRIESPRPGQEIASPLTITGEARGTWYFEGDFPVVLTDWDGRIIAQHYATAQGEWMTEDFVPFSSELSFELRQVQRSFDVEPRQVLSVERRCVDDFHELVSFTDAGIVNWFGLFNNYVQVRLHRAN